MFVRIKLMIALVLFALACGAFASIVIFAVDVLKWHDKESKASILPSNSEELTAQFEHNTESGVINNADESGEHNTSTFSFPRS